MLKLTELLKENKTPDYTTLECGCYNNISSGKIIRIGDIYLMPCVRCYREMKLSVLESLVEPHIKNQIEIKLKSEKNSYESGVASKP